jgi:hypothetical protein
MKDKSMLFLDKLASLGSEAATDIPCYRGDIVAGTKGFQGYIQAKLGSGDYTNFSVGGSRRVSNAKLSLLNSTFSQIDRSKDVIGFNMNSKALAPGSAGASLIPGTPGSDIFVRPYAPLPVQVTSPKIKVSQHQAVVDYRSDPESASNYTSILPSIKQNLVRGSPAQTFLKTAILRPPRFNPPYQSKTPHRVRMADQLLFKPIAEHASH